MVAERDDLSSSLTHIRGTATPRPEWSRCEGYVEDWAERGQGCSSDQLVDLLLAKISGKTLEEVTAHSAYQGQVTCRVVSVWGGDGVCVWCSPVQGLGEDVPRYLRWEGKVPNHRFSQSKVNTLISGFWKHQLTSDLKTAAVCCILYDVT